jgi:cytochrome P450
MAACRSNRQVRDIRRKFNHTFSTSHVLKLDGLLNQGVSHLVDRLNAISDKKEPCDLFKWMKLWSLDSTGLTTFGTSFQGLESGSDTHGVLSMVRTSTAYSSIIGIYPKWHSWLWMIFPTSFLGEKKARAFSQKQIDEKEAAVAGQGSPCFLDVWLRQKEDDKMLRADIRRGLGATLAGVELVPVVIVTAIYEIYQQPSILKKVRQEVDDALSVACDGNITPEMTPRLPYLQAIVNETMRLHPLVGFLLPRVVPEGGANLAGYHFRQGQTVGINYWTARMNPEYFGPDASIFRPERWLEDEEEAQRVNYYSTPVS